MGRSILRAAVALCCLGAGLVQAHGQDLAMAGSPRAKKMQGLADLMIEYLEVRYPDAPVEGHVLYVSVHRQRMFHVLEGQLQREYVISTARNGLGTVTASNKTPTGLHRVVEKFGAGVPQGGVFRERHYTGENMVNDTTSSDLITSRILWLGGLEPGFNQGGTVDSQRRGIYIHGTGEEATLGTPSSHGCVRMRNTDVIQLFDTVPLGTLVVILDN